MHCVYFIQSVSKNKQLYVGGTSDLRCLSQNFCFENKEIKKNRVSGADPTGFGCKRLRIFSDRARRQFSIKAKASAVFFRLLQSRASARPERPQSWPSRPPLHPKRSIIIFVTASCHAARALMLGKKASGAIITSLRLWKTAPPAGQAQGLFKQALLGSGKARRPSSVEPICIVGGNLGGVVRRFSIRSEAGQLPKLLMFSGFKRGPLPPDYFRNPPEPAILCRLKKTSPPAAKAAADASVLLPMC